MTAPRPAISSADAQHEHAVLATLLAEPERIADAQKRLKRAHFVDGRHGDVWAALTAIADEGLTPTLGDLCARLPAHDAAWLAGLLDGADPVGFVKRIGMIKKAHAERQVISKLALADAASPGEQRQEAIKQTRAAISRVATAPMHREIDWPVATVSKDGAVKPSKVHLENTEALLDAYGVTVAQNLMRHRLEITIPDLETDEETKENKTIEALVALAERNGLARPQTLSHIQILARSYHPVWDWVCSRPWDGKDRIADLLGTIALQPGSDAGLSGLLLARWLLGCIRAVMPRGGEPFRPQGVLTLQGGQGLGKSRWLEALAPKGSGWVLPGATLDPHDRDSVSQLTSVWIVELGELDGTLDRAHIAAVKAFVDRPADTYRRPYARSDETVPRRTMMAASVNPRLFLADETGSRRWWCIPVAGIDADHGLDLQQVWAQARVRVEAGERWWLDRDEQARLTVANARHTMVDPLVEDLWRAYEPFEPVAGFARPSVSIREIWSCLRTGDRTRADSNKLAQALEPYRSGKIVNGFATFNVSQRSGSNVEYEARH